MLTVGPIQPFELLRKPSSPDIWFLWRSHVRDDPSGPDHFASTCVLSMDHLELLHVTDEFLLCGFGLVDQSYRDASFRGETVLLAFLSEASAPFN